jgi:hypothetical protein
MVHAFDYGAAGDGETDDTEALQHALQAGDGVLRLPKGVYRITRPLVIDLQQSGHAAVLGEGGTTRIVMAGPGPALRLVGTHDGSALPRTVQPQVWDRERFPIVSGLEILGAHPQAVGIELHRTMQPTISQVLIRHCRYAIHLPERNRNVLITNCQIYDNLEYGIFFDRCNLHQINIEGCHISYCRRAGIMMLGGDVHNLQITGNDIEYNNRPGVDTPAEGGAEIFFDAREGLVSEVTIASNTIQATIQPGGANVRIWAKDDTDDRLGACLIAMTGNIVGSQSRGMDLRGVFRMTVAGNTLYGNEEFNIHAEKCRGLSVTGNTIGWRPHRKDPWDGLCFVECDLIHLSGNVAQGMCAGTSDAGGAVTFRKCRDIQVAHNQICDSLHAAIEVTDCDRVQIEGNQIVDRKVPATMPHALRLVGRNERLTVRNNLWGGATEALTSPTVIEGNDLWTIGDPERF